MLHLKIKMLIQEEKGAVGVPWEVDGLRCVVSAVAASATTLLRIVACVRNRGQATTRRWRRRQRQCACCAKPGKMGAASPQAFQDGVPDGLERARPAHRRCVLEHAGGNMHHEVPEQPNQYRRNPAIPSSPLVTDFAYSLRWMMMSGATENSELGFTHFSGSSMTTPR
ncbi:uncharacterized protein LOC119285950 isoform X2 [Triticum dicoccoides]|uniref:uncharacterized protein LOC119285950 isoform X2 n=1 Tax=Triticum dicoccoides TaxID=85692 RepID=UPI00188FAA89|nr:uncharacterized protein LOC119285950 isoform X2 [Triticum dicoccoides]